MFKKTMKLMAVALALQLVACTAYAGMSLKASPWTEKEGWGDQASGKFVFGATNLLFGWTEIITHTQKGKDDGNVLGGFLEGLAHGVGDTIGGALHVATVPLTMVDVPLPDGGTDILA